MSVEEIIDVGNGAGHVFISDEHMLAIVTNHADKFLSIIDMDWDDDGNIGRDATRVSGQKIQAHTASVSGIDLENLDKYADPDEHFLAEDMLDVEAELGDSYLIQGITTGTNPVAPWAV